VDQLVPVRPITEQTVAAWFLLNKTEKMTAFDVPSERLKEVLSSKLTPSQIVGGIPPGILAHYLTI
jgi:hypothetical protein